tara:strand:+ start:229 stop:912 length:684 start_codon:yes stop_codon:yes gene_type:complete
MDNDFGDSEPLTDRSHFVSVAQGDLSVNLFMALLALLAALSVTTVAIGREGYLFWTSSTPQLDPVGAPIAGWHVVLPVYPKLVIRGGVLHFVDTSAVAQRMVSDTDSIDPEGYRDSTKLLGNDPDPAAFQVFLRIDTDDWPDQLSFAHIPLTDLQEGTGDAAAFLARLTDSRKVDLFLFPAETVGVVSLLDQLHDAFINVRVLVMPSDTIFGFVQSGRDLGLERSFK